MPFTFAHPAIVLPLLGKKWKFLSATALIVGSIAPDFESFIGLGADKVYSHTWLGVLWFDLPLTLIICLVFHALVKEPLIDALPGSLGSKLERLRNMDWVDYANSNFAGVMVSALIGVLSHMIWDAATHLNLYSPDAITSSIHFHGRRLYILLQYFNSVVGLVIIAIYMTKKPAARVRARNKEKQKYWLFLLLLSATVATFVFTTFAEEQWLKDKVYLINVSIGSVMYGMIILSVFYKYISRVVMK